MLKQLRALGDRKEFAYQSMSLILLFHFIFYILKPFDIKGIDADLKQLWKMDSFCKLQIHISNCLS